MSSQGNNEIIPPIKTSPDALIHDPLSQLASLIHEGRLFEAQQILDNLKGITSETSQIAPFINLLSFQQKKLQYSLQELKCLVESGKIDHLSRLLKLIRQNRLFLDDPWRSWILTTAIRFITSLQKEKDKTKTLSLLLNHLDFHKGADETHLHLCFDSIFLPLLMHLLEEKQWSPALKLENYIYAHYVKRFESEENFARCFSQWTPAMIKAGSEARASLPAPRSNLASTKKIALLMLKASLLAHTEVLLNMLQGYQMLDVRPYEFHLYVINGHDSRMHDRFNELGIQVTYLDDEFPDSAPFEKLVGLKKSLFDNGIGTIVWISLAPSLAFSFAMRLAPRQVWWAMKYHTLEIKECDLYITSLIPEESRIINGVTWHGVFYSRDRWFFPEYAKLAISKRAQLDKFDVVLGTFGREEKIDKPEFLDAVADILRDNPNACYLWTGRNELDSITTHFKRRNVLSQTVFIGWVNTKAYAQVIDIFLDSFPFGCGYTLLEAMAAGKPAVFHQLDNPEHLTNLFSMIAPLKNSSSSDGECFRQIFGADGFLVAKNRAEYVQIANKLISDSTYRSNAGGKYREFVNEFVSDNRQTARQFIHHLTDNLSWH